jgi:hypothetical protein
VFEGRQRGAGAIGHRRSPDDQLLSNAHTGRRAKAAAMRGRRSARGVFRAIAR